MPRKHERVAVSLEVVWEATSGQDLARMGDISMGGCYIDTMAQAAIGEIVSFKVHLPTGHWVQLRGEVVHQFPNGGIGVLFVNLTEEDQILIEQVVLAHGGELASSESEADGNDSETQAQTFSSSRRVLVADDDPTIRHLVKVTVQKEGYPVITASDGREALDILETDADFVAAIFDMAIPHIDGLKLIRHMKAHQRLKHIPVGLITAEQNPKLWHDSISAGAAIFLPKPFTIAQLKFMLNVLVLQSAASE
jgi:CheY-like chemotaxis protein